MKFKFIKIFTLDLSYFILLIIGLMYAVAKIRNYIIQIQAYAPQLNLINPQENLLEAQNLLQNINLLATKTYLFIFLIIPLVIFILYLLTQGFSFYILKKQKKHFLKFALVSILPYIFLLLALSNLNSVFALPLLIIFIISSYLAFILYFKEYKELRIAYTKIYKLFPMYLAYLILALLILSGFFMTYISITAGANYIIYLVLALLFTLIFSYYKINLVKWI